MLKYPWEAEIEEFEARRKAQEEASAKEQVVENKWQSAAQTRVEDISKYGLEYWIYFQAIRTLSAIFLLISLLAAPKIAFILQGSAIQQIDLFAWIARLSLGNVRPGTKLRLGILDLDLRSSSILGLLDALQLALPLAFVLWFCFLRIPWLLRSAELRTLSAADYAVQVDGLPPRLPGEHANLRYDFEVVRHVESVLRGLKGADPSSFVCEAALARDFSGALLAAQERGRAEAQLRQLRESMKPSADRERRLKARIDAFTSEIASKRAEETDRPVWRAYVVLGTKEERARLLTAYRCASALPLLGRLLQPSHLRFQGRWPLVLTPAPEPGDIVWAHCRCSLPRHCARGLGAVLVLLLAAAVPAGLMLLLWRALLGERGAAAMQCSPVGGLAGEAAPCLMQRSQELGLGDVGWEPGCDCFCLAPAHLRTAANECRSFQSLQASMAVLTCAGLSEGAHALLAYAVPPLVERWRTILASDVERLKLAILAVARSSVPFLSSVALFAWKLMLVHKRADGLAGPIVWEVDHGWYLHAAPVAMLWCLGRWLGPPVFALGTCSCRTARTGHQMQLWDRWASLVCTVGVTIALQPLMPYLAPLAALGLAARHRAERHAFLRGHVSMRSGTPTSTAVRLVLTAFAVLWLAVAVGAMLVLWVYGEGLGLVARLWGPGLPAFCLLCISLAAPLAAALVSRCSGRRGTCKTAYGAGAALGFQEAWLMMRHGGILATYQIHEHPTYRGGAVLKELEPDLGPDRARLPAATRLDSKVDALPSLAMVGDKAPSRKVK